MKEDRRGSESKPGAGSSVAAGLQQNAGGGAAGKQTRVSQMRFGAAGVDGAAPAGPVAQAGGDAPVALEEPGAAKKPAKPPTVSVSFTETLAAPLTFSAPNYRELYQKVAARAGQEAGSVSKSMSIDTKDREDGSVGSAAFTIGLATMLPDWTEKASQPQPDQTKFNAWRTSVVDHEAEHRRIYKAELNKLKTRVTGPSAADVSNQADAVSAAAEQAQDVFDHASQPAALAAPGGMEKVQSTDASDVQPPSDTAVA